MKRILLIPFLFLTASCFSQGFGSIGFGKIQKDDLDMNGGVLGIGFPVGKYVSLGANFEAYKIKDDKGGSLYMPLSFNLRVYPLQGKAKPYLSLNAGYSVYKRGETNGGAYTAVMAGFRYSFPKIAPYIQLGMKQIQFNTDVSNFTKIKTNESMFALEIGIAFEKHEKKTN